MKVTSLSVVISLAVLFVNSAAYFSLDPFPDVVYVGAPYTVSWTASANYSYNIWLVLENPGNPYTWTNGTSLGSALRFGSLKPNFTWTVPKNLNTSRFYRVWIDAYPIRSEAANLNNRTDYFAISENKPINTASTTASAGNTAVATASAVSSTSSASSTSTSVPSDNNPGGTGSTLSGGAIAGIVVGCLLLLALIAGGFLFMKWHKKRSAFAERQAAARASRLDPVMQAHAPSYEMHGRSPQASKEINV